MGSTLGPDLVAVHPKYFAPGTASGGALLAHEFFHVWQYEVVPNFIEQYAEEAARIEHEGKAPWDNGFERPAYQFERDVRQYLLSLGLPN